jgi:hypothetical protein
MVDAITTDPHVVHLSPQRLGESRWEVRTQCDASTVDVRVSDNYQACFRQHPALVAKAHFVTGENVTRSVVSPLVRTLRQWVRGQRAASSL